MRGCPAGRAEVNRRKAAALRRRRNPGRVSCAIQINCFSELFEVLKNVSSLSKRLFRQAGAPTGVPAGTRFIIFIFRLPQENPLPAPVFPHGADPLGAGHTALQLRVQRVRVRRVHGHQQTAGSLGVIEQVLFT